MILINVEQGTPEWREARAGVLTASVADAALTMVGGLDERQQAYVDAILAGKSEAEAKLLAGYKAKPSAAGIDLALQGIDPAQPGDSAIREAWRIAIERVCGEPIVSEFETFATKRGHLLEQQARMQYEMRQSVLVLEQGLYLTDDGTCGYSTDGAVSGQPGGIEVKCPTSPQLLGAVWQSPATAEQDYLTQCEFGLWLTGWHWIDLIVYCPWLESVGKDMFIKRIWRDDDRIEKMEAGILRFLALAGKFEALLRADLPTRYESAVPAKFAAEARALPAASPDGADAFACAAAAVNPPFTAPAAAVPSPLF